MAQLRRKIYTRLRAPKAAAIAGILFAILLTITLALLLLSLPENRQDSLAWLTTNRNNAIAAMGALVAATVRAPLTAILLTMELSDNYFAIYSVLLKRTL